MSIQWKFLVTFLMPLAHIQLVQGVEFVHIKSGPYGQLVTSNTLRWDKPSHSKEPVSIPKSTVVICHLSDGRLGVVEDKQCTVISHDGQENSSSYQTLSAHASRVVWAEWRRPNAAPTGAVVAFSPNPHRFIAYSSTTGELGYLDTKSNLGTCIFPMGPQTQCAILTEIEPTRYELSDLELKKSKGFIEETVILGESQLAYKDVNDDVDPKSDEEQSQEEEVEDREPSALPAKNRLETVLSYKLNQYDYWGGGHFMAKGLHTSIKLVASKGSDRESHVKIIEWGIPSVSSDKVETVPVWEVLELGTAVNITIKGIHRKGFMPYYATLKTIYKDKSYSTRHIEGQRKLDEIQDIKVEKSRVFYLSDGSLVPVVTEPTTIITSSTQSLSHHHNQNQNPTMITNTLEQQDMTSPHLVNGGDNSDNLSVEQTENLRLGSATSSSNSNNTRWPRHDTILVFTTLISIILPFLIINRTARTTTTISAAFL